MKENIFDRLSFLCDNSISRIQVKEIRTYRDIRGGSPFEIWLQSIKDLRTRARIRSRLDRLALGNRGDYKSLGDALFELRLDFGPGYRIYYAEWDDMIVILFCGGDKRSQNRDIEKSKRFLSSLKREMVYE